MNDDQAESVIQVVLELAVMVRDEVGPGVREAAERVLATAGGDATAALCVAAALIRTDLPVVSWWKPEERPPPRRRVDHAPCGTRSAAVRHRARNEPIDRDCALAERAYWRERAAAKKAKKTEVA